MTAALSISNTPAASTHRDDDWSKWIEAKAAAKLLGCSAGNLRRRCAEKLQPRGLAKHVAPASGGNARWWVHRDYDRRLCGGIIGEQHAMPNLEQYTKKQQDLAWLRVDAVNRFRRARSSATRPQKDWLPLFIADLRREFPAFKVSQTSLFRWDRMYRNPVDVEKLIDARGGDQKSQGDPAAWSYFKELFLQQSQPSIKECWRRVNAHAKRGEFGWCSYKSCQRQLDDHIPKEMQIKHRDPKTWQQQHAPTIEQDPESWGAGELWESDHSQLDLWCRFGKSVIRPWLTAWKDWRTRKIVGWVLSPSPNSTTILAAFRAAMLDETNFGGPDEACIDNGKDYDSWMFLAQTKQQRYQKIKLREEGEEPIFRGIFHLVGIDQVHHSLPYNPNGKSRTERWFGTMHGRFDKSYPTYAGRSVDTRPEELERILKNPRLLTTLDQVREDLGAFINAWNNSTDHEVEDLIDTDTGIKLSPNQAMAHWCNRRRVHNPQALDHCLQHWHKPVRVGRQGITIKPFGQTLRFGAFDPALTPYKATKTKLYVSFDGSDLASIRVYDEDMRYIATVKRNERGGKIGREQLSELMKMKRQYKNALKVVRSNRELEFLTAAEIIELNNPPQPELPAREAAPALKLVATDLDGSSQAVQAMEEQQELRRAAGDENTPKPTSKPLTAHHQANRTRRSNNGSAQPSRPVGMPSLARLNFGGRATGHEGGRDE